MQDVKKVKCSLIFLSGKKTQFYHIHSIRVLTVKIVASEDRVHLFVTGACQNIFFILL